MKQFLKNRWVFLLLALVALNILAAQLHGRADLTQEKRYSLSGGTRNLLRSLDDELLIRVFLKGDFPAGFRKLSNTTQEFVSLLKETNGTRIRYQFINPEEDAGDGKSWADSLTRAGISPINLTVQVKSGQENKLVFPVALLTYKGNTSVVDLYPTSKRMVSAEDLANAEAGMEYQVCKNHRPPAATRSVLPWRTPLAMANRWINSVYDLQQTISPITSLGLFNIKTQNYYSACHQCITDCKTDRSLFN
jgi:ABC-2 type transport system permease protein